MQKIFVAALFTLGTLTITACPDHEEFQAATGTAVNTPSAKKYDPTIDVTNNDLDYEEDLLADTNQDDELQLDEITEEATENDIDME